MKKYKKIVLKLFTVLSILLFINTINAISIIPGEEGPGMDTPAGRGGEIYIIHSIANSGSGTLRECAEASGPRYCLFKVSGTINLDSDIVITDPYITIAGQTAPSPGITLKGGGIEIKTSDVLIQHIRIRVGDGPGGTDYGERDALRVAPSVGDTINNIVIDHVSLSWATDEVFSTWAAYAKIKEVTVMNSIISEALYNSYHPHGRHSMGALIGENTQYVLFKQNLLAFNNERNPLVRDSAMDVIIANNYIYNPGVGSKSKIYFGIKGTDNVKFETDVINNYLYLSPFEYSFNSIYIEEESQEDFSIYNKNNYGPQIIGPEWSNTVLGRQDVNIKSSYVAGGSKYNYLDWNNVPNYVLKNAGSRPLDRDAVDERILDDVKNRDGDIIDSQDEVGGWPTLPKNSREIPIPDNPNGDDDGDGYTNIEELLHKYSYWVEEDFNAHPANLGSAPEITNFKVVQVDGKNNLEVQLTTDELAVCHFDTEPGNDYNVQPYTFEQTNALVNKQYFTNLEIGKKYTYYVRCRDRGFNEMDYDYIMQFEADNEDLSTPLEDENAPKIISLGPQGTLDYGTNTVTLEVTIDSTAGFCHYDNEPNIHYLSQNLRFDQTTYTDTFTKTLNNLENGKTYKYYVRCRTSDSNPVYNLKDYLIQFKIEDNKPTTTIPDIINSDNSGSSGGGGGDPSSYNPIININNLKEQTKFNITTCDYKLEFSNWSVCSPNGTQNRIIYDINSCKETKIEYRICSYNPLVENFKQNTLYSNLVDTISSNSEIIYEMNLSLFLDNFFLLNEKLENPFYGVSDLNNLKIVDLNTGETYLGELIKSEKNNVFYYKLKSDNFTVKINNSQDNLNQFNINQNNSELNSSKQDLETNNTKKITQIITILVLAIIVGAILY